MHGIHRLGDHSILKHGLREVNDIIYDDSRARAGKIKNALSKIRLTIKGSVKGKSGARSHVKNDLSHGTALVRAPDPYIREYKDIIRQVSACLIGAISP